MNTQEDQVTKTTQKMCESIKVIRLLKHNVQMHRYFMNQYSESRNVYWTSAGKAMANMIEIFAVLSEVRNARPCMYRQVMAEDTELQEWVHEFASSETLKPTSQTLEAIEMVNGLRMSGGLSWLHRAFCRVEAHERGDVQNAHAVAYAHLNRENALTQHVLREVFVSSERFWKKIADQREHLLQVEQNNHHKTMQVLMNQIQRVTVLENCFALKQEHSTNN